MRAVKVLFIFVALSFFTKTSAQDFLVNLPNYNFNIETGGGVDTRVYINFINPAHDPVILTGYPPQGVNVIFQPDTILQNDSSILSVIVADSNLSGQTLFFNIQATDNTDTITKTIYLEIPDYGIYFFDEFARMYRDSAIAFLNNKYPNIIGDYGNLLQFNWMEFTPYPPLLVVSHRIFLSGNWRINVLRHVTIPPYDWKKNYIYNNQENVCWGIYIDTDSNYTEIACEKRYYFFQDTNTVSIPEEEHLVQDVLKNYPNPFSSKTTITIPNGSENVYLLRIYDAYGKLQRSQTIFKEEKIEILREGLKPGICFYRLIGEKNYLGKMVVTN